VGNPSDNQTRGNAVYQNYLSSGYARLHSNERIRHSVIDLFELNYRPFLPRNHEARILDIGCGMGEFLGYMMNAGYRESWGVDVGPEQIEYCSKHITNQVELIADLGFFLDDKRGVYDLITMNDVLDHLPKARIVETLRNIRLALKPDGQFIAKVENMGSVAGVYSRYNDFTHEVGFTENSFYQALAIAGFSDIRIFPVRHPSNSLRRLMRSLLFALISFVWRVTFQSSCANVPQITTPGIFCVATMGEASGGME
jgi:SAM-dependent methyltransferase